MAGNCYDKLNSKGVLVHLYELNMRFKKRVFNYVVSLLNG